MDPEHQPSPAPPDLPFPTKFAVEVTAECNLRCSMCHHPAMRRPKGRMPFALWRRCADQIARVSPSTECWFSFCGEPLLEPALLFGMIRYARAMGLRSLNIDTNGMLLTPELNERILDSGVARVVIGVDAFFRETYESLRCGGDRDVLYAKVEQLVAARALRGTGPEIQVQFIEMAGNRPERDRFRAHWLGRGATVKLRDPVSWGGAVGIPMRATPQERAPCPRALTTMHVFWDGRVPRCPGDTEGADAVGNAWHEPLDVLWARLGEYRRPQLAGRFDDLPERCRTCRDWTARPAREVRPGGSRERIRRPTVRP